MLQLIVCGC